MKIFITGNSGCGKTYIATKLSKIYKTKSCSLDDFVWQNNKKREHYEREILLNNFLSENTSWVIEGMSHKEWMHILYKEADYIFFLETTNIVSNARIIKRFIKKKLGFEKGYKETFKSLKNLFKLRKEYEQKIIPEIKEKLKEYPEKTTKIKSLKQAVNYIKKEI